MQQLCKSDADGSCSTIISFVICPSSFFLRGTVFCKALIPLRVLTFVTVGRWNYMQISAPLVKPSSLRFYPLLGEGSVSDAGFWLIMFLFAIMLPFTPSIYKVWDGILFIPVFPSSGWPCGLQSQLEACTWVLLNMKLIIYPTFWRILQCWMLYKLVYDYVCLINLVNRNLVPLINPTGSVYVLLWQH